MIIRAGIMNREIPATVVLSGNPSRVTYRDGDCLEMTISFKPPDNIAGKSCILKVVDIQFYSSVNWDSTHQLRSFVVTANLTQPYGFCSFNNLEPENPVPIPVGAYVQNDGLNQVIGLISFSYVDHTNKQGVTGVMKGSYPRCLVDIPRGPYPLILRLYNSFDSVPSNDDFVQMSVIMEIVPVED